MENQVKEYRLKTKCFVFSFFLFFLAIINHEKMVTTSRNVVRYNYMKAKTVRVLWDKTCDIWFPTVSLN